MISRQIIRTFCSSRAVAIAASSSSSAQSSSSAHRSENHPSLDTETKRKLISLYHHAASFVTPENLSSHIDNEFARRGNDHTRSEAGISFLKEQLQNRRSLPTMTTVNSSQRDEASADLYNDSWSNTESARSMEVKAALYGVDSSLKAGLETVEEYRASLPPRKKLKKASNRSQGLS